MYWHRAQGDTRRTVNKIIADGAIGILVLTGIGSSPCPLEDLKLTLDSIILNDMQKGPEEQLFFNTKGIPMPREKHGVPRLSWLMVHSANPLVMKRSSGG